MKLEIRISKQWKAHMKQVEEDIAAMKKEHPDAERWASHRDYVKYRLFKGGCTVGDIYIKDNDEKVVLAAKKNLEILSTRKGANKAAKILAYKNLCNSEPIIVDEIHGTWRSYEFNLIDVIRDEYDWEEMICLN